MDDLISRKAAIDALEKEKPIPFINKDGSIDPFGAGQQNQWYRDGIAIMNLPSAPRWIPVTKRLPEDLEEVNVTWVNHAPEPYYDFVKDKHFSGSAVYYNGSWYWYSSTCVDILAEYGRNEKDKIDDGIEVVAWMPLPEPYERSEEWS